jgi:hypothetical protein
MINQYLGSFGSVEVKSEGQPAAYDLGWVIDPQNQSPLTTEAVEMALKETRMYHVAPAYVVETCEDALDVQYISEESRDDAEARFAMYDYTASLDSSMREAMQTAVNRTTTRELLPALNNASTITSCGTQGPKK